MSYSRIKQPKISDVIMMRLEEMILEGSFKPGQALPPERELASQFEVSRPSLREAIQKLSAKGLLVSRQGGGTFVSQDLGSSFSDPLLALFKSHPESQYDLLEFRHALEGVSAYYAAMRSTSSDKAQIKACYDHLEMIHQRKAFDEEVEADVDFHLSIAAATHNMVLLHMMRALFGLLKEHIRGNLQSVYNKSGYRDKIHQQHGKLLEAILAGDPELARKAAHHHLAYVEEALLEQGKENTRLERALRRSQRVANDEPDRE